MKRNSFIVVIILCALHCFAQDDSQTKIKKTFSIDGAVCVTTDGKAAYYNMGGAQIKFDLNHKVAFTFTFLPALGIRQETTWDSYGKPKKEMKAVPLLGIGPQIFIRKLILSFPFCYNATNGTWVSTAGIGYRIQYSKTK